MSEWTIKTRGAKPALRIEDHQCSNPECAHVFELTLNTEEEHDLPWTCPLNCHFITKGDGAVLCTSCTVDVFDPETHQPCAHLAPRTHGVASQPVTIVRGNSDFAERQHARLYDRSTAHFKKEGREEAIERQRAQFKREGMVQ